MRPNQRVRSYADAQERFFGAFLYPAPAKPEVFWTNAARAVIAVADLEQAYLRAEVWRLRVALAAEREAHAALRAKIEAALDLYSGMASKNADVRFGADAVIRALRAVLSEQGQP